MNVAIIQARMGSTRLPGKVLKPIQNGKTILETLVDRISPAKKLDKIVIATTDDAKDTPIAEFCESKGIEYHRGSEWDVLDRFYQAAKKYEGVKNIIRITSDCPLHSHKVIDEVVGAYENKGVDYYSNSNNEPDFLEDGFDTEVFTFASLETAWKEAKKLSEREHVTPYIKFSGKFTCDWGRTNKEYDYKMSVDSPSDYAAVSAIFEELKDVKDFAIDEVTALLKKKPEILELNKESVANAGYIKSLENDKNIES